MDSESLSAFTRNWPFMSAKRMPASGTSKPPSCTLATPPTCGCAGVPLTARSSASQPAVLRSFADIGSTSARSTLSAWIRPRSDSPVGFAEKSVSAIG